MLSVPSCTACHSTCWCSGGRYGGLITWPAAKSKSSLRYTESSIARKPGSVSPVTFTPRACASAMARAAGAADTCTTYSATPVISAMVMARSGRLAFALRRPRQHMTQRRSDAVGAHLGLQIGDQLAVLGVDLRQCAQLAAAQEAGDEVLVGQHQSALVGQEELEARDAVVAHHGRHLAGELRSPPRHGHVKAVVDHGLGSPAAPDGQRFQRRLAALGSDEIDERRGAAGRGGSAAGVEIVGHDGAHHRQLQMGVRIDAARHHETAAGVDHLRAGLQIQAGADGGDHAVAAQQVGALTSAGRDQRAAANEDLSHGLGFAPAASRR